MISPAGSDRRRGAAGFSLVELLAVAAIMGLLAGVAAVSLRGLRTPALSSAANEVASAAKMTRQMAIASGRSMYLVMPLTSNSLTGNPYRTYAIFEEVKPGEEMKTPDSGGNYPMNPATSTNSWFIPRTEWRVLPEGAVFSSLAHTRYSPATFDGFGNMEIGALATRNAADTAPEWQNFSLFLTRMSIRRPSDPQTELAALANVPFIRFVPSGRASLGAASAVGLTVAPGFTKGDQVAVTDTSSFFVIEADTLVGRIRVRTPESYAQP